MLPKYGLRANRSCRVSFDVYVPGPLTHRAQLLSGAAPLPKFAIAVKENWSQRYYSMKGSETLKHISRGHDPNKSLEIQQLVRTRGSVVGDTY